VTVSFIAVLANAALNYALVHVMGYRGLALGTSIAALLNASLLLVMLSRRLGGHRGAGDRQRARAASPSPPRSWGAAAIGVYSVLAAQLPSDRLIPQIVGCPSPSAWRSPCWPRRPMSSECRSLPKASR
jgi:hypothetical protein